MTNPFLWMAIFYNAVSCVAVILLAHSNLVSTEVLTIVIVVVVLGQLVVIRWTRQMARAQSAYDQKADTG